MKKLLFHTPLGQIYWLITPAIGFIFIILIFITDIYLADIKTGKSTREIVWYVYFFVATIITSGLLWFNSKNTEYKIWMWLARAVAVTEISVFVLLTYFLVTSKI